MANHFENIDKYFGGEMSAEEMQQFETRVNQDPQLQQEFSFQQELVEGIQSARKAELKSMLNNVNVTGTGTVESGALTKILGGVAVAGVVAVGAYLFIQDKGNITTVESSPIVEVVTPESTPVASEEPLMEEATKPLNEEVEEPIADDHVTTQVEEALEAIAKPTEIIISKANITEGFEDETEVSETDAPINHMIAKSKVTPSTIEVSVEESKKYNFHYQVKNNSLSLYGDFSEIYEIIEFHKDGNTSTYLNYHDKYYEIDKFQSKPTPLVELTGDGLLALLDSIENNKER